jgi:hypothetical protein
VFGGAASRPRCSAWVSVRTMFMIGNRNWANYLLRAAARPRCLVGDAARLRCSVGGAVRYGPRLCQGVG